MERILVALCIACWCGSACAHTPPITMPWLCLERCGFTAHQIDEQLQSLAAHNDVITAASFELFNLGPNSTLVVNNLTNVGPRLKRMGFRTFAMVSSYPYPPQFIQWMRQVFDNPTPFIVNLTAALKNASLNGVNIDWEPAKGVTVDDGARYASFLRLLSTTLRKEGLTTTVDIATWSPIWNYTLLAQSGVDYVVTMSTYAKPFDLFADELAAAVQYFRGSPLHPHHDPRTPRLVVGMETWPSFTQDDVMKRFDLMRLFGLCDVGFWSTPIPEVWWKPIEDLRKHCP